MRLLVNLRHLEEDNVTLDGELSVEELDIDTRDEVVQVKAPLRYELEVKSVEDGLLVSGDLRMELQCQCVRCLKSFPCQLELAEWARHLPLKGEEAVPVVSDCVYLTPYLREDILLEFPQHPLCEPECRGLSKSYIGKTRNSSSTSKPDAASPDWSELNKLKF